MGPNTSSGALVIAEYKRITSGRGVPEGGNGSCGTVQQLVMALIAGWLVLIVARYSYGARTCHLILQCVKIL